MTLYLLGLSLLVTSSWAFLSVPDIPGVKPLPSQNFTYHQQLDENYDLHWDFNDTHIIFETHVKTNGFTGFGISPTGGMKDADIVIGWVKDGQPHFADRHGIGKTMPVMDKHQDWTLLGAAESGHYTSLKMVRKLDTCDSEDRPILKGTTKVIFSYNPVDPVSDDNIQYHGPQSRGTKSLLLLDPPTKDKDTPILPDGVKTFDFINQNYSVPSDDTTYLCTFFKLPDLGQKHHMIRYEPLIQKGHEKLVHHIILYHCNTPLPDANIGASFVCEHDIPKEYRNDCVHVFIAWAIGGTAYDFPSYVGQSLGAPGDPGYFRLETHYDNPELRSDFVDNSGFRIFLTTQLRQHDVGVIETGLMVDIYQAIPPHEENFLSTGTCPESCIERAFGDQEVRVFATILHSHLLGTKLRTRHFRNGVELPPLQEDNSYDFNYQEMRALVPERILKKGDSLITECEYDSRGRINMTWGGLSTRHEMCLSFLWFYPKVPLSICLSRPLYDQLYDGQGRAEFTQKVTQMDWTKKDVRDNFKKMVAESRQRNVCHGNGPALQWVASDLPPSNVTRAKQPSGDCTN